MKLSYEGHESINADVDSVWNFINNPEKLASCLPYLVALNVHNPENFDATLKLSLGPLSGPVKFNIFLQPDKDNNIVNLNVKSSSLGNNLDLNAKANLLSSDNSQTEVNWDGEADVNGPAAVFGGNIIEKKVKNLVQHVFTQVGQQLNQDTNLA